MPDTTTGSKSDAHEPISNGPNARPRDESISSTAEGLPNDTSKPLVITPDEEKRIDTAIRKL